MAAGASAGCCGAGSEAASPTPCRRPIKLGVAASGLAPRELPRNEAVRSFSGGDSRGRGRGRAEGGLRPFGEKEPPKTEPPVDGASVSLSCIEGPWLVRERVALLDAPYRPWFDEADLEDPDSGPIRVAIYEPTVDPAVVDAQSGTALAVIAHGFSWVNDQGCPVDAPTDDDWFSQPPSFLGYGYLARFLASWGVTTASIDLRPMNAAQDQAGRETIVRRAAESLVGPFLGRAGFGGVSLIGHSLGGAAVSAVQASNLVSSTPLPVVSLLLLDPYLGAGDSFPLGTSAAFVIDTDCPSLHASNPAVSLGQYPGPGLRVFVRPTNFHHYFLNTVWAQSEPVAEFEAWCRGEVIPVDACRLHWEEPCACTLRSPVAQQDFVRCAGGAFVLGTTNTRLPGGVLSMTTAGSLGGISTNDLLWRVELFGSPVA